MNDKEKDLLVRAMTLAVDQQVVAPLTVLLDLLVVSNIRNEPFTADGMRAHIEKARAELGDGAAGSRADALLRRYADICKSIAAIERGEQSTDTRPAPGRPSPAWLRGVIDGGKADQNDES